MIQILDALPVVEEVLDVDVGALSTCVKFVIKALLAAS